LSPEVDSLLQFRSLIHFQDFFREVGKKFDRLAFALFDKKLNENTSGKAVADQILEHFLGVYVERNYVENCQIVGLAGVNFKIKSSYFGRHITSKGAASILDVKLEFPPKCGISQALRYNEKVKLSVIVYDAIADEILLVAPKSIEQSFKNVMAEGYLFCQWGKRSKAWRRRRSSWVTVCDLKSGFKSEYKALRKKKGKP